MCLLSSCLVPGAVLSSGEAAPDPTSTQEKHYCDEHEKGARVLGTQVMGADAVLGVVRGPLSGEGTFS